MASRILRVDKLSLDTSEIEIESLYENIGLRVHVGTSDLPLSSLGTGHQSAVIMHLYRQLGEDMPGEVLYLFEEPDNHLHPSTIRSICDDLRAISKTSQVLVSTHSPVFLAHAGFQPLRPLIQTAIGLTVLRKTTLLSQFTEKQARAYLESYGLRLTEPLLSSRVIVVEGVTDKVVLSTLFEKRTGATIDQADFLLLAAGGKVKAVALCNLLNCLGVDWRCVMDRDAAFSSEVPYSRLGLSSADLTAGIAAIATITAVLDTSAKRGRNAVNSLNAVHRELSSGRPSPMHFEGSPLKTLLDKTRTLSTAEQTQLKG
jgi:predicted ATP-dependent endonuclease of OLD family